jgi:hypothetical protein
MEGLRNATKALLSITSEFLTGQLPNMTQASSLDLQDYNNMYIEPSVWYCEGLHTAVQIFPIMA